MSLAFGERARRGPQGEFLAGSCPPRPAFHQQTPPKSKVAPASSGATVNSGGVCAGWSGVPVVGYFVGDAVGWADAWVLAPLVGCAVADADEEAEELDVDVVVVRRRLLFVGMAAVRSASTTSCPASSPSVISTQPPPTVPVFTVTLVVVSAVADATTFTVAVPVPVGVTAEAGNLITPLADFTAMATEAFAPVASSWLASATATVVA